MKKCFCFVVFMHVTVILGFESTDYLNTVTWNSNVTTADDNSTTSGYNQSSEAPSTAVPFTSSTQKPTSADVISFSITTGTAQSILSTTASPGPWKVVTFALIGIAAVLLVALTVVVVFLCKMWKKLGQASKTLYPITPGQSDHEYLDLEEDNPSNKKVLKVELKHMTVHNEEEFASPTILPTPPEKPKRKPPPPPSEDSMPRVPARTKKKSLKALSSKTKDIKSESAESQDESGETEPKISTEGKTNLGFVMDGDRQRKSSQLSSSSEISLYNEEDEMYETYEKKKGVAIAQGVFESGEMGGDIDVHGAYEEPVKTSQHNQLINRQGSSTGLPDLPMQKVSSKEIIPLQVEDVDDLEDFGAEFPGSGLPGMTGMQHFNEDEFFDDPEKMTQETTDNNDDTGNNSGDEDQMSERSKLSSNEGSPNDILTYDDADMVIFDEDEPADYENAVLSNESRKDDNTPTPSPTLGNKITREDSSEGTEQVAVPTVPPRSDLLRTNSESDDVVIGSFDDMILSGANQRKESLDPENEVQLRLGRQVSAQGKANPRDSYYLFMDDKTMELRENNAKEHTLVDRLDISGLSALSSMSGTSEISVDLSNLVDTRPDSGPKVESGSFSDATDGNE